MTWFYIFPGIPSRLLADPDWKEPLKSFCQDYESNFPDHGNLDAEMTVWDYHWKQQQKAEKGISNTVQTTLKSIDLILFPNILRAMCILGILPITTYECERSASHTMPSEDIRRRSPMSQKRLSGLCTDACVSWDSVWHRQARQRFCLKASTEAVIVGHKIKSLLKCN